MSRLASPRTAAVLGAIVLALLIGSVAVAQVSRQLTLAKNGAPAVAWAAFLVVGVVVAYRRPSNPMGWLLIGVGGFGALNILGASYSVLDYRVHHGRLPLGPLAVLVEPSWAPTIVLIALSILLYPEGSPPSPRWRWPLRAFVVLAALWVLGAFAIAWSSVAGASIHVVAGGDLTETDNPTGAWAWWGVVQSVWFPVLFAFAAAWVVSQVTGYRRLSGERRLQQKWIISGATIGVVGGATQVFLSSSGNAGLKALATVGAFCLAGLPIAMGVGIVKYRLYEIDRIVSRTLSYAIVTALLVATFIGLVELTTQLLPFSSTVEVAASTLASAALFNPLRVRVQRGVDRRFNRTRYDAELSVAAFAARLRDAVDLDAVQAELLEAVRGAVQPTHATIWMRRESL
jgi:hypothetical protein